MRTSTNVYLQVLENLKHLQFLGYLLRGLSQTLFSIFQNHNRKIKLLTIVFLLTFPFKRSVT